MSEISLPAGLTSAIAMTPLQMNKIRFVRNHTVITPQALVRSDGKSVPLHNQTQQPNDNSIKKT
ncbi:MAG: hypothetical protein Q4F07_03865 [Bacteroidales bacterium]|nr:hypothetical protein [Bacteroidales bacterium]